MAAVEVGLGGRRPAGEPEQVPGGPEQVPGGPEQVPGGPEQVPGGPEQVPGGPEQVPGESEQVPGQPDQNAFRQGTATSSTVRSSVLPVAFYGRPVLQVARELIGCIVEHEGCSGRIVETEAYHESEPACHAFVGVTPRTRTLFGEPGTVYVYRSYGIHALLNAVCEPVGVGAAVLIRALEPLEGIELMRVRRCLPGRSTAATNDRTLCSGPGKLTQALGIELTENATSLIHGPVSIRAGDPGQAPLRIAASARIGITKAVDLPWRFCATDSKHLSRPG